MRYSTAPKRAVEFFIQLDKLLFGDVLNSDIIVGDGFPVPVILEQNHIAAGDKMLFPFGQSKNALHFWRDGKPVTYGEKWRLLDFKFQFDGVPPLSIRTPIGW